MKHTEVWCRGIASGRVTRIRIDERLHTRYELAVPPFNLERRAVGPVERERVQL